MTRLEKGECFEKAIIQQEDHKKNDKRTIVECKYYLMLSSRMRTRKRGRPGIFQHCLMNCRVFWTHRHTQTHRHHFILPVQRFNFQLESVVFLKFTLGLNSLVLSCYILKSTTAAL